MKRRLPLLFCFMLTAQACRTSASSAVREIEVSATRRDELVRSAQVFQGVEDPSTKTELEIKNGPFPEGAKLGKNYFEWGQEISCKFSDLNFSDPPGGMSPKFLCDILDGEGNAVLKNVKIKYDRNNPELYNEASASRLLWLLGYPADHYYAVKVRCKGCPMKGDVWAFIKDYKKASPEVQLQMRAKVDALRKTDQWRLYDPALIEKKWAEPVAIAMTDNSGWSFFDDLAIDPASLAFPEERRAEELTRRHALTILAGMLAHVDNQPGNQRIYCRQAGAGDCPNDQSWLIIHDLGATMGGFRLSWDIRSDLTDKGQLTTAMNTWRSAKSTAVFTSDTSCKVSVASLDPKQTLGPLKQVAVSEAGREFLLSRFYALGGGSEWTPDVEKNLRRQLGFIFTAGRNGELFENNKWWVDTLLSKLEIVRKYRGCI